MQVVSVNTSTNFRKWEDLGRYQYLCSDLFYEKNNNIQYVQNLNKNYSNFESDNCSLLLGEMLNNLRNSDNIYDYDADRKVILKRDEDGIFIPINHYTKKLIKSLYTEFMKLNGKVPQKKL